MVGVRDARLSERAAEAEAEAGRRPPPTPSCTSGPLASGPADRLPVRERTGAARDAETPAGDETVAPTTVGPGSQS